MIDPRRKHRLTWLLLLNAAVPIIILLFLVYRRFSSGELGKLLFSCRLHDLLHIYCPACGWTRATSSLLRLDLVSALRQNVTAVVFVFGLIYADIRTVIAALRDEERLFHISPWTLWSFLAFALVYTIFRNILLLCFSVDITGDFLAFTQYLTLV